MGFNKYLGYGLSTLALYFINKRSSSKAETSTGEADALKVSSSDTKIGTPIPAVMGRCLIKSPIISYFGDFKSKIYTEEYAAHSNLNVAPLIMALLAYMLQRATGHVVSIKNAGPMPINAPVEGKAFTKDGEAPVVGKASELTIISYQDITPPNLAHTSSASGKVPKPKDKSSSHPIATKDDATGPLLYSIITWLLGFLINKRNLKTTIQKGFKYYLGYQFLVCWSGQNIRVNRLWLKEHLVYTYHKTLICIGDSGTAGYPFTNNCPSESSDTYSWTNIVRKNLDFLTVINKGIGGNTTTQMLDRFQTDVLNLHPDACLIIGMDNDPFNGVTFNDFKSNIQSMVNLCKSNNIMPLLGTLTPAPNQINTYVKYLNTSGIQTPSADYINNFYSDAIKFIHSYAENNNIPVGDLMPAIQGASGNTIMSYIGNDYIHPNKLGYKTIGQHAAKLLAQVNFTANNFQKITVNDYNLFGGPDEQGGFDGELRVYLGGNNQGTDDWMINQMNNNSVQKDLRGLTPAYRPFVSIVVPTAYIGKQSTIPETWVEIQSIPNRLGLGAVGNDANPAEVLFELHVNNDWGLGENENLIDKNSLIAIGKTLATEGIGISIQLSTKIEAKDLINNILTHINAYKFMDTATGKMSFKLVRDDYDPATAFLLDIANCSNVEFTRPDWHETVGRVNVSYTDRINNYEEASVPAVDPANVEINHTMTEKSYQYTYFTTSKLALWAAKRELTEQAYPLANVEITANRTAYAVRIGDVVRLNWKPYGIKNMLIRVTKVDLGDLETGQIKITGMEDIWGLNKTDFNFSGSTEWQPEEYYPTGVQVFKYLEMPWELSNSFDTYVSAMAAKPDEKTQYWTVWRQPSGEDFATTTTKSKWTAAGRLVYDMGEFDNVEDITGIEIAEIYGIGNMPSQALADIAKAREGGGIIIIDDEIIAYSTLTKLPNGHWYVKGLIRGTFDTVPKAHYGQANVFFIRSDRYANVTTGGPVCEAGTYTDESYNITTSIGKNKETFDILKVRELKTKQRSEAPSPPGKIRMSDHNYTDKYHANNVTGNLTLSFVERNKLMSFGCVSQNDDIEYWSKQKFKIEDGTDYLIKVTVAGKTIEKTCTQSPFIYAYEDRCNDFNNLTDDTYIALYARNNKLLSYQAQERHFSWTIPTMVDGNLNQQAATNKIKGWERSDRLTIPKGSYSSEQQILYSDMPIILLGTSASKSDAGAILIHDGSYIIPNGDILVPTDIGEYETHTMAAGYTFISYFIETATGGKKIYEWDGSTIIERTQ